MRGNGLFMIDNQLEAWAEIINGKLFGVYAGDKGFCHCQHLQNLGKPNDTKLTAAIKLFQVAASKGCQTVDSLGAK